MNAEDARLELANTLELAGYIEDAEHLRKKVRIGDVLIPHSIAVAAMLSFFSITTRQVIDAANHQ